MDVKAAATELFHQYHADVYRYALFVLGNPDDAEDVLQEVFLRVVRAWDGFRGDASEKTWLWRILKNCIMDSLRKRQRQSVEEGAVDVNLMMSGVSDSSLVEWEDVLRVLSVRQRQVVYLRLIDNYTTQETAKMLGYTKGTVRVTLHRAVQRLRDLLKEDWHSFAKTQSTRGGTADSEAVVRNDD